MIATVENAPLPTGHPLLLGRFYPEYDIPVSLIWLFIILAGVGNWVVIWCTLKTKSLRNPFNMIVVALAFSNGVATTVIGPMELIRILMSYQPVTVNWCNTRVLLKTFSFSNSILIIFTLSVLRLKAGLLKTHKKLSYKEMAATIIIIYSVAIATSPVLLDKTSSTYRVCLGNVAEDIFEMILENEDRMSLEVTIETSYNSTGNEAQNVTETYDHSQFTISSGTLSFMTGTETSTVVSPTSIIYTTSALIMDLYDGSSLMRLWVYYLIMTIVLFVGTVICYIWLIIILKRHTNAMAGMVLGNSKDILTMRVTAYVTCSFFVSFLVPFFPGLVRLPPVFTPATLHYISIFHCLSSLDGALTPLIYYFSNKAYRHALSKALPRWIKADCCRNTQVAPNNPNASNNSNAHNVPPPPPPTLAPAAKNLGVSHRLSPDTAKVPTHCVTPETYC